MCSTCILIFVGGASPISEIFLFLNLTNFPFHIYVRVHVHVVVYVTVTLNTCIIMCSSIHNGILYIL